MSRQRVIQQISAVAGKKRVAVFVLCEEGRLWFQLFDNKEHPWQEVDPLPPITDDEHPTPRRCGFRHNGGISGES